jgi:hypothetical protein
MYSTSLPRRRMMATPELTKQDLQTVCNGLGENIETLQRWLAQTQAEAERFLGEDENTLHIVERIKEVRRFADEANSVPIRTSEPQAYKPEEW